MATPRRTANVDITTPITIQTRRRGRINTVSATFVLQNPIPHVIEQDANGNILVGAPIKIRFRLPTGSPVRFALMEFRQSIFGGDFDGERNMPFVEHVNGLGTRPNYTITNFWRDHSGYRPWRTWKIIIYLWAPNGEIFI